MPLTAWKRTENRHINTEKIFTETSGGCVIPVKRLIVKNILLGSLDTRIYKINSGLFGLVGAAEKKKS